MYVELGKTERKHISADISKINSATSYCSFGYHLVNNISSRLG